MRKFLFLAVFALVSIVATAQEKCFWVFFTDKNDTQFDPYSYFDAKAIERYQQCGADLYDISNYPLNDSYRHRSHRRQRRLNRPIAFRGQGAGNRLRWYGCQRYDRVQGN